MAASEAAVTAVSAEIGCEPNPWSTKGGRGVPARHHDEIISECAVHHARWTDRGCPVAVAAADAAVDADRASIQAEVLREFAEEWPDEADSLSRVSSRYVRNSLLRRADRIEGKP